MERGAGDFSSLIGAVSTARPISIHVEINIPLPAKRNDINYFFSRPCIYKLFEELRRKSNKKIIRKKVFSQMFC